MIQICPVGSSFLQTALDVKLAGREDVFVDGVGRGEKGREIQKRLCICSDKTISFGDDFNFEYHYDSPGNLYFPNFFSHRTGHGPDYL